QTPEGDFYTSNAVGRAAANFLTEKSTNLLSSLTPTEKRVLQFLAQGLTSKEIADHLSISARTVQAHRRNMTEKLNLRGANRLMEFAVRNAEKI
ncbi:MAG: helix-turn-helix transcriptional regulator, partial [Parasphingorhabdus sp.]